MGTTSLPSPRSSVASASPSRIAFDEYAPASPRSEVITSIAARVGFSGSVVSGCSALEKLATADTARVMPCAYGVESFTRCWALTMRDAAISSNALVILAIDFTERIRCR